MPLGLTSLISVLAFTTVPASLRASGYTGDIGALATAGHAPPPSSITFNKPSSHLPHSTTHVQVNYSAVVPVPALLAVYALALSPSKIDISLPHINCHHHKVRATLIQCWVR